MFKPKFQYYNGNIQSSEPIGYLSIEDFVEVHKNPKQRTVDIMQKVVENKDNKLVKRELKQQLHFFTPQVNIGTKRNQYGNITRNYDNITCFTGLAQIDIDCYKKSISDVKELKLFLFNNYKSVVTCYLSPSGNGVKALFRIPIVYSVEKFKDYYHGLLEELKWLDGLDKAPQNAVLPLFISIDKEILYRQNAEIFNKQKDRTVEYINVKKGVSRQVNTDNKFSDLTINIFNENIDKIVENGHPQVVRACLILGSRSGAGYISLNEALSLAENKIRTNSYLKKNINGYIKTSRKFINDGYNNPIRYKADKQHGEF